MTSHYLLVCDTCGHRGAYKSAELARYHFGRHSCALVQERRDRAGRRLRRLASEGERRDCTHPEAGHQHGTYAAYVLDLCRCYGCKVANRTYEQQRARDKAYGRPPRLVSAAHARAHIFDLMRQGMGLKTIAAAAGLHNSRLSMIVYGANSDDPAKRRPPRRRIDRGAAEQILAVQLELAAGARIPSVGTTRRIHALVAVGWSLSKIAAAVGALPANFTAVAHGRRDVTVRTAQAIADLYDAWWDTKPPTDTKADLIAYRRSLNYAAEHGWPPPLAWDDDEIDDPAATPAVDELTRRRSVVVPEDIEWMFDNGATVAEMCARLKVAKDSIEAGLKRQGRDDLWQRLWQAEERRRTAPRRIA
jgi:transcriptional regulator with XRE-family HTH domain